jgi:hypothetical protein
MSHRRRSEILQQAQMELRRSHDQRLMRRRVAGSALAVLAITATLGGAWLAVQARSGRSGGLGGSEGPSPNGRHARAVRSSDSDAIAQDVPTASATAVASAPPSDSTSPRFQVVTNMRASQGFVETLNDQEFEMAVRSLARPTGIAVIGGRTHLVANPEWRRDETIR